MLVPDLRLIYLVECHICIYMNLKFKHLEKNEEFNQGFY